MLALWTAFALAATPPAALVEATPFRIEVPYDWTWGAQVPPVREGWLLVLEVDPALARPRPVGGQVLFVGDWIAEPLNPGWPSGCVVALVGPVDLAAAPIFYAPLDLPERVDRAEAAARRDRAWAAGARPMPPARWGRALESEDIIDVLKAAAERIESCAPEELAWAEKYRMIP